MAFGGVALQAGAQIGGELGLVLVADEIVLELEQALDLFGEVLAVGQRLLHRLGRQELGGAVREGVDQAVGIEVRPRRRDQAHGEFARQLDLAHDAFGAKALGRAQRGENPVGDLHMGVGQLFAGEFLRQAPGRRRGRGEVRRPGRPFIDAGQAHHLFAQIVGAAQDRPQGRIEAQQFGDEGVGLLGREGPRLRIGGQIVVEVEQHLGLRAVILGVGETLGDGAAQAFLRPALGQDLLGQLGEALGLRRLLGGLGFAPRLCDALFDKLVDQANIGVDRGVGALGARHGDLLNRALEIGVRSVQIVDEVGAMEQFQRGDLPALEPAAEHAANGFTRRRSGQVVRRDAGQRGFALFLGRIGEAFGARLEHGPAAKRVLVRHPFLALDAHRALGMALLQGVREIERLLAVLDRLDERPVRFFMLFEEDLEVNVVPRHVFCPLNLAGSIA